MTRFSSIPFARILLFFIAGIILQIFFPLNPFIVITGFSSFILFAAASATVKKYLNSYKLRALQSVLYIPALVFSGMLIVLLHNSAAYPLHFKNYISRKSVYIIRLTEPLHEKEKSYKVCGSVEGVMTNAAFQNTTGRILLYFPKDSAIRQLGYGDYILASVSPSPVEPPLNPAQFNYREFLSFHGIYHQLYLANGKWTKSFYKKEYYLLALSYKLREAFVKRIKNIFNSKQELGVASALLVGLDDFLDDEIIQAFSSAGALHVLSVSGMHVGLVYVFLSASLFFLNKRKWTMHLKNFLLLSFIWFYAMITGFSPAVLRSAVMISMVIVAKWASKRSDILNTMFASAFLLLLYDPYMITEVGFQLSYLAVFGIVYVHPQIVQLWEAPNWFLHQVWTISSVSFAAQLMTFPLGLLYFHQFPNLFLISNLVVIPVSTLIIYMGMLALMSFFITGLADFFWYIAFYLTKFLNLTVKFVEGLWFAMIDKISITVFETWILYTGIAASIAFFMYKQRKAIFLFLGCIILFFAMQLHEKITQAKQQKIIFYSVKGNEVVIDFIKGNSTVFFSNDLLYRNSDKMLFFIIHNWFDLGIDDVVHVSDESTDVVIRDFYKHNGFIMSNGNRIYIADKILPLKSDNSKKINVNYLFVTADYKGKISNLLNYFSAEKIVISPDVPPYRENLFIADLNALKISYHSLRQFGALQADVSENKY